MEEKSITGNRTVRREKISLLKLAIEMLPGFLLIFLLSWNPHFLHSEENKSRASIAFSFGYFMPQETAFRETYGNCALLFDFNIRYFLKKSISVSVGLKYLSHEGETKVSEPEIFEEKYKLKFTMYSIPIAIMFSFSHGNIRPFFGGGTSYNLYSEKWDQFNISFENKKWGMFFLGGVEYFISRKFSLFGKVQYNSILTNQGSKLARNVNLGGIEFSLGLSFHLR